MSLRYLLLSLATALLVVWIGAGSLFVVDPHQEALVLRSGRPVRVINSGGGQTGLHAKLPWVERVVRFDRRDQPVEVERDVVTADGRRLVTDAVMQYRIADPVEPHRRSGAGGPAASLQQILDQGLRAAFATVSAADAVGLRREQVASMALDATRRAADHSRLGVAVVDLRLRRLELDAPDTETVDRRMAAIGERQTDELHAWTEQQQRAIAADADKQTAAIRAAALAADERIRGEGNAERAAILAAAYGKDPGFARFYRTIQAYQTALGHGDATIVLTPGSGFLRDFDGPLGQAK